MVDGPQKFLRFAKQNVDHQWLIMADIPTKASVDAYQNFWLGTFFITAGSLTTTQMYTK